MLTDPYDDRGTDSGLDRDELLRLSAQRLMIFREVIRQAVRALHSTARAGCESTEAMRRTSRLPQAASGESQFRILRCLVEDGPLTVSEIATSCRVSAPAISRMLNALETNGLIERRVNAINRRITDVVVTDAGRKAEAEMIHRFEIALAGVLSPLTTAELVDLVTAFGHLERLVATSSTVS